jgi:hypothetical protein
MDIHQQKTHTPPPRNRKRAFPTLQLQEKLRLFPSQNQHVNLDFYDPVYRPIFSDPIPHSTLSLEQSFSAVQEHPSYPVVATPPVSIHRDNCSSCCDGDNCSDKCENEDCTDGCEDCTEACLSDHTHCGLDECPQSATCVGLPRTPLPAPCLQATLMTCQTVICEDKVCPVETGICAVECVEAIYCHKEKCEDVCDSPQCDVSCPMSPCEDTACYGSACLGTLPSHSPNSYNNSFNCVSFHVNNANSNRWHDFQYPDGSTQYASVSPTSLTLSDDFPSSIHNFLAHSQCYDGSHGILLSGNIGMLPQQQHQSKRRKISDAISNIPELCHGHSETPSSAAPTPISSNFGDILCLWDEGCDEGFMDTQALQAHIQNTHIGTHEENTRCLWDGCGLESSDPNSLLDHIIFSHAPQPPRHVCMWEGCDSILNTEEELQLHINSTHLTSASQCRWDACDTFAPTEVELEKHVQSEHLVPHSFDRKLKLEPMPSPTTPVGIKICEWQRTDAKGNPCICGEQFQSSAELQKHVKKIHITTLKKKTGYHCHWVGCNRRDKPFSQKGKVERHLQTHTGCKITFKNFLTFYFIPVLKDANS